MKKYELIGTDDEFTPQGGRQLGRSEESSFQQYLRSNVREQLEELDNKLKFERTVRNKIIEENDTRVPSPEFNNMQLIRYFHLNAGELYRSSEIALFVSHLSQFYIIKSEIFGINQYIDYYVYLGKIKDLRGAMIIPLTGEAYNELHI